MKTSWKSLQVEQLATWNDLPRRLFLVFLSVLFSVGFSFYVLLPKYVIWKQLEVQTLSLQKQYVELAKQNALFQIQNIEGVPKSKQISHQAVAHWYTQLASEAQKMGLSAVQIRPITAKKSNNQSDKAFENIDLSSLNIVIEGSYENVFQYLKQLSEVNFVLSMDQIKLSALGENRVQASMNVLFLLESQP